MSLYNELDRKEQELNDAVNELTTYIDMLADSIADEKEWYD